MSVNADEESQYYARALAVLQFFASSGPAQVASWERVADQDVPWFFEEHGDADRSAYYFYGIACIFFTYSGFVTDAYLDRYRDRYEKWYKGRQNSEFDMGALSDFSRFLNCQAAEGDAAAWSKSSALEETNVMWEGLRQCARGALKELGERVPSEAPAFVISDLIDADEFRLTDDEIKTLDRDF